MYEYEKTQVASFRTQRLFLQIIRKISKFLLKTSFSATIRGIFEIGLFFLIAQLAKISPEERAFIIKNRINITELSIKIPLSNQIVELFINLLSSLNQKKLTKNKQKLKEYWNIMYEILEKLIDIIITEFQKEVLYSIEEEETNIKYSISFQKRILNSEYINKLKIEEQKTLRLLLLVGTTNPNALLKKIYIRKEGTSLISLKLWIILCLAIFIKILILAEKKKENITNKEYQELQNKLQLEFENLYSLLKKVKFKS